MKRQFVFLLLAAFLMFLIAGCNSEKKQVKELVEDDVQVWTSGDMNSINEMILGFNPTDAEFEMDPQTKSGEGFLGELFAKAEINLEKIQENEVLLEITAPDMSGFFREKKNELAKLTTEEEMRSAILDYAGKSEKVTRQVSLEYTNEDSIIRINYLDPDFLDAMTGGFVTAYAEVYREFMEMLEASI